MAARTRRRKAAIDSSGAEALANLPLFGELFSRDARIGAIARVSPSAALQLAIDALNEHVSSGSVFDDWRGHCLHETTRGQFDQDEAFVSFFQFCTMLGLPDTHRLSYAEFATALDHVGLARAIGPEPGGFRLGGRLVDKFGGAAARNPLAPLGEFIEERCEIVGTGRADRVKSQQFYDNYVQWAVARGATPASIQAVGKALKARGFRKIASDGMWWQGLRLRPDAASGGRE